MHLVSLGSASCHASGQQPPHASDACVLQQGPHGLEGKDRDLLPKGITLVTLLH